MLSRVVASSYSQQRNFRQVSILYLSVLVGYISKPEVGIGKRLLDSTFPTGGNRELLSRFNWLKWAADSTFTTLKLYVFLRFCKISELHRIRMPSLSFDNIKGARPIARVKGGEYDGEVLYLHEDSPGGAGKRPKASFNRQRYTKNLAGLKPNERTKAFAQMEEALSKGVAPDQFVGDDDVKGVYEKIVKESTSDKAIELDDAGMFELLPSPDPKRREVWYIAGQSGSGKSYIAKGIAHYYHKLYPERGVYLVSKLNEDSTLDTLKFLKRINIQSFVDDYPDLDEFKDCMVIFDDYDTLTGDAEKVITKIVDDLAIMCRHTNTTMLCLSH